MDLAVDQHSLYYKHKHNMCKRNFESSITFSEKFFLRKMPKSKARKRASTQENDDNNSVSVEDQVTLLNNEREKGKINTIRFLFISF